jgi:hypothetical protein
MTMLYDDIIEGVQQSALHRHPGNLGDKDSRSEDRMGASSGCPEAAKGTSFRQVSTAQSSHLHESGSFH